MHTDAKSFPDGLDTEVVKFSAIEKAYKEADLNSEREHVTPYVWKNGTANGGNIFKTYNYPNPVGDFNADDYRITIDEPEDFEVIKTLIEHLGIDKDWKDYIDYLLEHKEVYAINSKFSKMCIRDRCLYQSEEFKLRRFEKSGRETGGFMLNITGLNRFFFVRNFHDIRCK